MHPSASAASCTRAAAMMGWRSAFSACREARADRATRSAPVPCPRLQFLAHAARRGDVIDEGAAVRSARVQSLPLATTSTAADRRSLWRGSTRRHRHPCPSAVLMAGSRRASGSASSAGSPPAGRQHARCAGRCPAKANAPLHNSWRSSRTYARRPSLKPIETRSVSGVLDPERARLPSKIFRVACSARNRSRPARINPRSAKARP